LKKRDRGVKKKQSPRRRSKKGGNQKRRKDSCVMTVSAEKGNIKQERAELINLQAGERSGYWRPDGRSEKKCGSKP